MIDDDSALLAGFRGEVPAPDAETAQRIYRLATTPRPGWQVLLPGRLSRHPRLALAGVVASLVLVPGAVAFGGRLANLFHGKPAPANIRQDFIKFNATMQQFETAAAKAGFVRKTPQAIAARAHGVLALRTSDGPVYLWAAPRHGGGLCWLAQFAGAKELFTASCDQTWPPGRRLIYETFGGVAYAEQFIFGRALGAAASVVVALSNGEQTTLPVVEGLFIGAFPRHVHPLKVASYDPTGFLVGVLGTLAGGTAEFSPAERRALSRVSARGTPFPLTLNNPFVHRLIASGYQRTALLLATRADRNYFRFPRTNGKPAFGTGRVGLPSVVDEIVSAGTPSFPAVDNPLLDMSTFSTTQDRQRKYFQHVGGIAADGVARVVVKDREGRGLLWLPVRNNVYDSGPTPVPAGAVQLDSQDAQGRTVARLPR